MQSQHQQQQQQMTPLPQDSPVNITATTTTNSNSNNGDVGQYHSFQQSQQEQHQSQQQSQRQRQQIRLPTLMLLPTIVSTRKNAVLTSIIGICSILVLMVTTEFVEQRDFYDSKRNGTGDDGNDDTTTTSNQQLDHKLYYYFPMNVITLYGMYGIIVICLKMNWFQHRYNNNNTSSSSTTTTTTTGYAGSSLLFTDHNPYLLKSKIWFLGIPAVCIFSMIVLGMIINLIRFLFVDDHNDNNAGDNDRGGYQFHLKNFLLTLASYCVYLLLILFPLGLLMVCVVVNPLNLEDHTTTTTTTTNGSSVQQEQQLTEANKVYNKHLVMVFMLLTLHYVYIAHEEHDLFNIRNFQMSVENIIYVISYIIVSICLYVLQHYSPTITNTTTDTNTTTTDPSLPLLPTTTTTTTNVVESSSNNSNINGGGGNDQELANVYHQHHDGTNDNNIIDDTNSLRNRIGNNYSSSNIKSAVI